MSRIRKTSASIAAEARSVANGGFLGEMSSPVPVPRQQQRLGSYRLCLELASGGMASVYLARAEGRTGLHRFVALKRVHPHLANDSTFVEMFLDEARIASLVQHPNVCSVFDFDSIDGEYYLAMEFLLGEPLSAVFRAMARRPLDEVRTPSRAALVARIVADACEGLHAAHELRAPSGEPLGVVHRDVSPENIFLTYDGVVKVVDFGIALAENQRHMTVPGMIKGKLAYMPPEVLRGMKPDRRADVWGLGVLLWELLTGQRLFHRSTDIETLRTIAEVNIPLPSKLMSDVPEELDSIVLRALTSDRDQRYATTRELGRALSAAVVKLGDPAGLAELSEWMDELFPAGRACKRQLLEMAASNGGDSTAPPPPIDDAGPDDMRPTTVRSSHSALHDTSVREKISRTRRSTRPKPVRTIDPPPPRDLIEPTEIHRRWPKWAVATVGAVALSTFCGVLWMQLGGRVAGDLAVPPVVQAAAPRAASALPEPAPEELPLRGASTVAQVGVPLPIGPGPYSVEVVRSPGGDPGSWMLYFRPLGSPGSEPRP
jgi:serine/threonine-protein kinase